MKITINNRWTNACIWEGDIKDTDSESMNKGAAVLAALKSGANLIRANLSGANLIRANLSGADLPKDFRVARLDFGGWSILVMPEWTKIGCQKHPNANWLKWEPEDVRKMAPGASDFWARHEEAVRAVIRDVMGAEA